MTVTRTERSGGLVARTTGCDDRWPVQFLVGVVLLFTLRPRNRLSTYFASNAARNQSSYRGVENGDCLAHDYTDDDTGCRRVSY